MKTGDKVVCVDDRYGPPSRAVGRQFAEAGRVYVIRGTVTHLGTFGIYLVGLVNPIHFMSGLEYPFDPARFRLLDELKAQSAAKKSNAVAV